MQTDELLTYTFLVLLLCSFMASIYFWFFKKQRTGWNLWAAYAIRLAGGLFFGYAAFWSYQVLWEEFPSGSTVTFISIFAVPAILMGIPWGYLIWRFKGFKKEDSSVLT